MKLLQLLSIAISLLSCKSVGVDSTAQSLNSRDVGQIMDGKRKFDQSTKKYIIALYSENSLSSGGSSFWDGLQSLVKTNIGAGYKKFIISNAPKNAFGSSGDITHFQAFTKTQVLAAIDGIIKQINQDKVADNISRVEIFFHLLAHGSTVYGGGDGFFSLVRAEIISDGLVQSGMAPYSDPYGQMVNVNQSRYKDLENTEQRITWQELWGRILEPFAAISTEVIAILEPCFSGNIMSHIPRSAKVKNILVLTGESSQAPQAAIGMQAGYVTSLLTQSLTFGLKGYANDTHKMNEPFHIHNESLREYGLKNIDDVTVSELVKYARINAELKSCERRLTVAENKTAQACSFFNKIEKVEGRYSNEELVQIMVDTSQDQGSGDLRTIVGGNSAEMMRTISYKTNFGPSRIEVFFGGKFATDSDNIVLSVSSQSVVDEAAVNRSPHFVDNLEQRYPRCKSELSERFKVFADVIKETYFRAQTGKWRNPTTTAAMKGICQNYNQEVGRYDSPIPRQDPIKPYENGSDDSSDLYPNNGNSDAAVQE